MGISKKIVENINKYLLKKIKINFTFLNIVNEKNLKKRLLKRKRLNRYDKFKHTFYKKVQKGFIHQAKLNSNKYLIVNSNIKIEDNKRIIINKINKILHI
jgi:dTMP kinase